MRIGVVADTHLREGEPLPAALIEGLGDCDLILHAGDLITLSVAHQLEKIAPTRAVCGNMDDQQVRRRLPPKLAFEVLGRRIGMTHGSGAPDTLAERVRQQFQNVSVIVFGHSHRSMNEWIDGTLMFNPGSPTDRIFADRRSYGIIEIEHTIVGEIIGLR